MKKTLLVNRYYTMGVSFGFHTAIPMLGEMTNNQMLKFSMLDTVYQYIKEVITYSSLQFANNIIQSEYHEGFRLK